MHLPVYENLIGRSEAFIHFLYPKLLEMTGDTLRDVSERELYEAINMAVPGLIRMEADELTYCLHIMIRYELEKAFVNGETLDRVFPALWNQKYKEYLGVDVPNDTKGCLQDVHWTGSYGYFPPPMHSATLTVRRFFIPCRKILTYTPPLQLVN